MATSKNSFLKLHAIYLSIILLIIGKFVFVYTNNNSEYQKYSAFQWYIAKSGLVIYRSDAKENSSNEENNLSLSQVRARAEECYASNYLDKIYRSKNRIDRIKIHIAGYRNDDLNKLKIYLDYLRVSDPIIGNSKEIISIIRR